MFVRVDYKCEVASAKNDLMCIFYGKDLDRAKLAQTIMRDKKVFRKFVDLRIKKKKAEYRKKLLTDFLICAKNIYRKVLAT